tara:strand:- start:229 stop:585 length:357 start_codon:yes stop_codon:yes gene_type:complete
MARKRKGHGNLGHYSFVAGILLAVVLGLFGADKSSTAVKGLIVLGLLVGFLNVTQKEVQAFLVASVTLMVGAASFNAILGMVPGLGTYLTSIMMYILVFVAPAAMLVSLKAIYGLAAE